MLISREPFLFWILDSEFWILNSGFSSGDFVNRTIIVIPHYGSDQLLVDLFQSAGFSLPVTAFQGEASLIELPSYSFLIINNNRQNRGFTAACNIGLNRLTKSPAEYRYAWLLNNDTGFESRAQFEHALEAMQSVSESRNWGIVSQQVRHFVNRDIIVFGGAHECYPAGRHKFGSAARGDCAAPTEEKWVTFCSVLIRRDLVESIGPMDESMRTYYSDSDYCLAARQAGFGVGFAGKDSYVFHRVGQSANPSDAQLRVLRGDRQTFWKKWIGSERHASYLDLMSAPDDDRSWCAGDLRTKAGAFPDLRTWLSSLKSGQKISLQDILQHFEFKLPPTEFVILCHLAERLIPTRRN
jgi:GT2 family glycosyltransferase